MNPSRVEITNWNKSEVIRSSKNLRVILDYRKTTAVEYVHISKNQDGGANFEIIYSNGNICQSWFNDFSICINWMRNHIAKYYGLNEYGKDDFITFRV